MKDVYFLTEKGGAGSSYLMGNILSKYCNGRCVNGTDRESISQIKNSYVILIKKFIGFPDGRSNKPSMIEAIKKNNNKIVYIVNDSLSVYADQFKVSVKKYKHLYDLVLFPSKYACEVFSERINSDVIYHLWDPQLKPNTATKFSPCYFGIRRKDKVTMIDGISHINCAGRPGQAKFYTDLLNYNCHYSVRKKGHTSYDYGVNTKLCTAAATNSNIICSKDNAFIDLLPDYNYYVNTVEEALEMLLRVNREYESKKWFDNLSKLQRVKDITSPHNVGRQLLHLLSNL